MTDSTYHVEIRVWLSADLPGVHIADVHGIVAQGVPGGGEKSAVAMALDALSVMLREAREDQQDELLTTMRPRGGPGTTATVPVTWGLPDSKAQDQARWMLDNLLHADSDSRLMAGYQAVADGQPCPHPRAMEDSDGRPQCACCGAIATLDRGSAP